MLEYIYMYRSYIYIIMICNALQKNIFFVMYFSTNIRRTNKKSGYLR